VEWGLGVGGPHSTFKTQESTTSAYWRGHSTPPVGTSQITVARVKSAGHSARGTQEKAAAIGAATEASLVSFSGSLSHVVSLRPSPGLALQRSSPLPHSSPSHPKFPLRPVGSVALSILGFGVVSTGWVWGRSAAAAEELGGEA